MFFRRIKGHIKEQKESYLLAFEVAHFLIDLIIVVHILAAPMVA